MTKTRPHAPRKDDVLQKLEYAESLRNELMTGLFNSYETDELPRFVAMKAEGVLSNARECFDYLAHDLIESYLLPVAPSKFVDSYREGREKTYFPFYAGQLKQPRWPWHLFKAAEPSILERLSALISAMDRHQRIAKTSFDVRDFRVVQEMVNEKKHSKIVRYEPVPDSALFHKGPLGSLLIGRETAAIPGLRVGAGFGGDSPKSVPTFRFTSNTRDVADLCLFAVHGTTTVLDWFYETYFAAVGARIDRSGPMNVDGVLVDRPMWEYESP